MFARTRLRRFGSPYQYGCDGVRRVGLLAALAFSSFACGRFGFERLDGELGPDSGLTGPRLTTGYEGGSEPSGGSRGGDDPGQGGSSGGNGPGQGGSNAGNDAGQGGPASDRCSDGARNGDEVGVDCGGSSCVPCPCSAGVLERLGDPNYPGIELWSPAFSSDGLSLYFGFTGPEGASERIAQATRGDRVSPFGQGQPLPSLINEGTEGSPYLSSNGLSLYFYSRRGGGMGNRDIYVATRPTTTSQFDTVTALSSLNGPGMDHQPEVSADQLSIYFVSDRSGNVDIWRSTRGSVGAAFGVPLAVSELNTSSDEGGITLSSDGLEAIITSNRPGGAGARDLYRATRASTDDPFNDLQPLSELNTPDNEIDPALSADGKELYFASNRAGAASNLYRVVRSCPF
jgi:Tol biopolymer transport system component